MSRRPHHLLLIVVGAASTCLGLSSCGVDNSFDPVPPGGRREIFGSLSIDSQLEADNLAGIRRIVGDLTINCYDITHLTGLKDLQAITGKLTIRYGDELEDLSGLGALGELAELEISNCDRLQDLDDLAGTRGVTRLQISFCDSLATLPPSSFARHVATCVLTGLPSLTSLAGLTEMWDLAALSMSDLADGLDYSPLAELDDLTGLTLTDLDIERLPDLSANVFLDHIYLRNLPDLAEFSGLSLPYVRDIQIRSCPLPTSLEGIGPSPSLRNLNVSRCHGLTSLATGGAVGGQAILYLFDCDGITDLTGLDPSWNALLLDDCDAVDSVEGIPPESSLTAISLSSLPELTSLEGLTDGLVLSQCGVFSCPRLASLGDLTLRADGRLSLLLLPTLEDLAGLDIPESLTELNLTGVGVTNLAPLAPLRLVHMLTLSSTPLVSLAGLEELETVQGWLEITNNELLDSCLVDATVAGWNVACPFRIEYNGPCAE
jgi:hypothetical protein